MKRSVAQWAGGPSPGSAIDLSRFTQPTRLIIHRLLLEGRGAAAGADLLRMMLEERMSGVYGVTPEQSEQAREEISRRLDGKATDPVPLEEFSDPTQRVILLFAADRGGTDLAPESVGAAELERLLDRDMTLLPGVGGGKAMRARREIRDILERVLRREIPERTPARPRDTSPLRSSHPRAAGPPAQIDPEIVDLLLGADAALRLTIKHFDILEFDASHLAEHLRQDGRDVALQATRATERSAVEALRKGLDAARRSLDRAQKLLTVLSKEDSLPEASHVLTGVAETLAETSRRLFEPDQVVWEVGAELSVWTDAARGDAESAAYLLVDAPNSILSHLRELRAVLLGPAERLNDLVRIAGEPRQPDPADELLIGSSVFTGAVIRGEDWAGLVEGQGLDPAEFGATHARRLRDLEIARRRRAGDTLADIGEVFAMSRERVRQIVRDVVASLPAELGAEVVDAGRARRRAEEARLRARLVDEVISTPRPDLSEMARRLGIEEGRAWEVLGPETRKFVRRASAREHDWQDKRWSDEAMKDALLEASLYVPSLSGHAYDEVLDDGLVEGPSRGSIINRFGSWNEACLAAGVTPNEKRRDEYERRWSDAELIDHVVRFLLSDAPSSSLALFETWRLDEIARGEDVPSAALLRIRIGGWSAVVERAWDRVVERGWLAPHPEVQERLRGEVEQATEIRQSDV